MARLSGKKANDELKRMIDEIEKVRQQPRMSAKFKKWQRDTQDVLSAVFGLGSKQYKEFEGIRYNLAAFSNHTEEKEFDEAFYQGLKTAAIKLSSAIKDLDKGPAKAPPQKPAPSKPALIAAVKTQSNVKEIPGTTASSSISTSISKPVSTNSNKMFLLYAFDSELQREISDFLSKLRISPIILQSQPSQRGKLAIGLKLHQDVNYALIVLDHSPNGMDKEMIFDLGTIVGKLGNDRVCGLVLNNMTDLPHFSGISYVPYDPAGGWKFMLIKQLKSAGFTVDANLAL